jgi:hypothetical protein
MPKSNGAQQSASRSLRMTCSGACLGRFIVIVLASPILQGA